MPRNRIRELRELKGLSVNELARRSGLSHSYVSRLERDERGKRGMIDETAEKIALALGADVSELLRAMSPSNYENGKGRAHGFMSGDAEPYSAAQDDIVATFVQQRPNLVPFAVTSAALDRIGIQAGDVVIADMSADAVRNVKALQTVVAQVYDRSDLLKGLTVIRQFVPPSLLTSNSSKNDFPPIDIEKEDAHIKGVATAIVRIFKA